jgi:hypothetical protein
MKEPNADDLNGTGGQEGFTMSYRCGDYRTTVAFDGGNCHSVVANIVNFLLGCGFSPNNVIDCMAESAESLEDAWFAPHPASMDQELLRKWNLDEVLISELQD